MKRLACALAAGLAALPLPAAADGASPWEKLRLGDAVQSFSLGGDLRLRYDGSYKRGDDPGGVANIPPGINNRSRLRLRLRAGVEVALPRDLKASLRFATGGGEQTSTNQTFDNLSAQKEMRIDTVALRWSPRLGKDGALTLSGGRMPNPLWRVYSSDLIWDDDFNPEGLSQSLEWEFPGAGLAAFGILMQMVADEDPGAGKNQWVFSEQAGVEKRLPRDTRLRLAAAFHKWSDENRSSLGAFASNDGNRRTANTPAGVLLNRFSVGELTGQLSGRAWRLPARLQATLARNFGARNDAATITGPAARDGYQWGVILGKAEDAGTWEGAYFKKYSETDATVADVADSDFGDGGTNRAGHIFWIAWAPWNWAQARLKYLVTDTLDRQFAPGDKAVNRLQADFSVKF